MVSYHLKALETMGMLARRERSSRGLVLNDPHQATPRDIFSVPMVGVIVARAPAPTPDADALRSAEEYVYIAKSMVKTPGDLYALRVKGNSMIDALINDGDIVVMQKVNDINNGDLAAVRLMDRDETTLKRVFKEGKRLKLKPENPTMAPFYVDARHAEIQGRVMCVIRNA
jgi:repressor LexA